MLADVSESSRIARAVALGTGLPANVPCVRALGPRTYPPELVVPVIEACDDVAVKMVMILCAFGGTRPPEALHLLDGDILPGAERERLFRGGPSIAPVVVLADPVDSSLFGGHDRTALRRIDYLAWSGLAPRCLLPRGDRYRAGWKGIEYADPQRRIAEVFWIDQHYGLLFATLAEELVRKRKQIGAGNCPWLFVGTIRSRPDYGTPLTLAALRHNLERSLCRLGVPQSISPAWRLGAFRHFYKSVLEDLGVERELIRYALHHKTRNGQDHYGGDVPMIFARFTASRCISGRASAGVRSLR